MFIKNLSDRRNSLRLSPPDFWVKCSTQDYEYLVQVADISENGIYLKTLLKSSNVEITIQLNFYGNSLECRAKALYNKIGKDQFGTACSFIHSSLKDRALLRKFLRNLDQDTTSRLWMNKVYSA